VRSKHNSANLLWFALYRAPLPPRQWIKRHFLLVWRLRVRIEGLAIRPCFGFTLLHDAKRTLIHPGTDIAGSLVCAGYTDRETTISKATIANIKAATNKKRGVRLLAGDGRHPILPHWQV